MIGINSQDARARALLILSLTASLAVAISNFTNDGTVWGRNVGRALKTYETDFYPPDDDSAYVNTGTVTLGNGAGDVTTLAQVVLRGSAGPTAGIPYPQPGETAILDSFVDIFVELRRGPAAEPRAAGLHRQVLIQISNPNPPGGTGEPFDIEMLAMSLTGTMSGSSGAIPFILRESPTLASTGKHSVTPVGSDLAWIDSFFDVFFEISFDGGSSFFPASGPMRLGIVPEPATIGLAILGMIGGSFVTGNRKRRR